MVMMEDDRAERSVAGQSGDEVRAARRGFGDLARDPVGGERARQELGPGPLVPRRVGRVHHEMATTEIDGLLTERGPIDHDRSRPPWGGTEVARPRTMRKIPSPQRQASGGAGMP
jgi:hypothetical protein